MRRSTTACFALSSLAILSLGALALGGCSSSGSSTSSGSSGGCVAHTTTADLTTPQVSFKNDVMPIFTQACTFSSCHGGNTGGLTMRSGDASGARKALVDVPAVELPSMKRVAPGDPKNSFLMHKVDGDACTLAAQCTDGRCGDSMPQGGDLLDEASRDTIRRWIAQGAKDD